MYMYMFVYVYIFAYIYVRGHIDTYVHIFCIREIWSHMATATRMSLEGEFFFLGGSFVTPGLFTYVTSDFQGS